MWSKTLSLTPPTWPILQTSLYLCKAPDKARERERDETSVWNVRGADGRPVPYLVSLPDGPHLQLANGLLGSVPQAPLWRKQP